MNNEFHDESAVRQAALMYEVLRLFGHCAYLYGTLRQTETPVHGDLSLNDLKALEIIIELEALTVGQLTQLTGFSAGGTTAVLERLERAGFIIREKYLQDRRVTILRPNPERCAAFKQERESALSRIVAQSHHHADEKQEEVKAFLKASMAALKTEASRYLWEEESSGRWVVT